MRKTYQKFGKAYDSINRKVKDEEEAVREANRRKAVARDRSRDLAAQLARDEAKARITLPRVKFLER